MNYQDYARECLNTLSKQSPSAQNMRDFATLTTFLELSQLRNNSQTGVQTGVQTSSQPQIIYENKTTLEIDGDTEFEQVLIEIKPEQYKEMIKIFNSLVNDIKIINNRAYLVFIDRLKKLI